jgi:hypothetical protein
VLFVTGREFSVLLLDRVKKLVMLLIPAEKVDEKL